MDDKLEALQDIGRKLGDLVAESIALDIDLGRVEHLLLLRILSETVRERFPSGENPRADAMVEQFATHLRSQWRQVPGGRRLDDLGVDLSRERDPADLTDDRVRLANEFLEKISQKERAEILSRIHFCWSCGTNVGPTVRRCPSCAAHR